jgi:gluconokinase
MIILVMGVSGSGKTTIGRMLADALHCAFLEGDALHPAVNVEKMSDGIPLTDADRAPWLAAIHSRLIDASRHRQSLVVACSALRQSFRDVLGKGVPIVWVYLRGSAALIESRLRQRTDHFMKPEMLSSQFDALEEPVDAIVANVADPPRAIVEHILTQLPARTLARPSGPADR